jgi:hypothetical protein
LFTAQKARAKRRLVVAGLAVAALGLVVLLAELRQLLSPV